MDMPLRDSNSELEQRLWRLQAGDHLCCLYESEEEHHALLSPFIRQGLERHEKVLYIVDDHSADQILGYLSADGVVVKPYLQRRLLSMMRSAPANGSPSPSSQWITVPFLSIRRNQVSWRFAY